MKRIRSSLGFALLLVTTAVADPGFNLKTNNIGPGVQGRKVDEIQYGSLDAVSNTQRHKRGGLDLGDENFGDIPSRIAPGQPLDVGALLHGAGQGQGAAGPLLGGQQSGQGIDAVAIINGLSNGQQGNNANAPAASSQRQSPGAVGSGINAQTGDQGIDASAIIRGLANGQRGGTANEAVASGQTQGQGQASVDVGAPLAGQNQQQGGDAGLDASALLDELAQDHSQGGSGTNANGANIESELTGGARAPSLDEILSGLDEQKQNQDNGVQVIEVKETVIQIHGAGVVTKTVIEGVSSAQSTPGGNASCAQTTPAENAGAAPPPSAPQAERTTLSQSSLMLSLLGSTQGADAAMTAARPNATNATATVIASSGAASRQQQPAAPTASSTVSIDSAQLTQDGLVAATTTSAAGSAVTVQVSGNGTVATNATAAGASLAASGVTVIAGLGDPNATSSNSSTSSPMAIDSAALTQDGLVATTTTTAAGAAVTVEASGGGNATTATGLPTSSTSAGVPTGQASAITVVASNGTATGAAAIASGVLTSTTSSINSATLTQDGLVAATTVSAPGSAVTVVAENGGAQAAAACNCACSCPAGSFPMSVPEAQPFQIMPSMGAMSSASTMETKAITVVAGGSQPANLSQAATSTSIRLALDSATLTTVGLVTGSLVTGSTTTPAGASVTLEASSVSGAQTSTVPAESQATESSSSSTLQQNRLPFDISTISLETKVTVNLGARAAQPTEYDKRGLW